MTTSIPAWEPGKGKWPGGYVREFDELGGREMSLAQFARWILDDPERAERTYDIHPPNGGDATTRDSLSTYWRDRLYEMLDERFTDGTSVLEYVLFTNPTLRTRLDAHLSRAMHRPAHIEEGPTRG